MSEPKIVFIPENIELYYGRGRRGREYTVTEDSVTSGYYGAQCSKCKNITPLRECSNCGGETYIVDESSDRRNAATGLLCRASDWDKSCLTYGFYPIGLFCRNCDSGFTSVTCGICGTDSPVAGDDIRRLFIGSFGKVKSRRCFVATAAFGSADAPEVVYLSAFRDESLMQSRLGRVFIYAYYQVSPSLAAIIAKSDLLRMLVRKTFLQPVIFLLRHLCR